LSSLVFVSIAGLLSPTSLPGVCAAELIDASRPEKSSPPGWWNVLSPSGTIELVPALPRTQYARSADGAHIAFQVMGTGDTDLLFVPWWWNQLETQWDDPLISFFLGRLAGVGRLILFDMRGVGLSDPAPLNDLPTLERWTGDALAVLDAAKSERALLLGHGDGGLVALLLAATHPERCSGLILLDAYARLAADDGYEGWPASFLDEIMRSFEDFWGTGSQEWVSLVAPSQAEREVFREQLARQERLSVSPGAAAAMQQVIGHVDVRPVLPAISTPTLVLHHRDNFYMPLLFGQYLASHIHDARLTVLEGGDHLYWIGDVEATLGEIEQFATGSRGRTRVDRGLATVLFTDVVDSTEVAADLGDERWRWVLDRHHEILRQQLQRFEGREVKTTGDGVLATFDGPARAIACACAIRDGIHQIGLRVRAGIHTGEVEWVGSDVAGMAVHIGQRISALADPDEVLVSRTVVDLVVGSGIEFEDRGTRTLKGVPGTWNVLSVRA
jgi:class 3 adenylate cyclase